MLRGLNISRRHKKTVLELLEQLAAEGRILRLRGGRWADAGQIRTVTGVVSIQRSGAGFVTPDKRGTTRQMPDLFIPPEWLGGAWHGDTVEAALIPGAGRQAARTGLNPEGRILRVVNRGVTELAVQPVPTRRRRRNDSEAPASPRGRFCPQGVLCRPTDPRFPILLDVDVSALSAPPAEGEIIMAVPGKPLAANIWSAVARGSLGIEDAVTVQERLTRLNYCIPLDFPPDAEAEAAALSAMRPDVPGSETDVFGGARRADLRSLPFVTIDGADARDFDDAVCVETLDGKTFLWVAIADVSLYVRPRTGIDREAFSRGNSCYFPASVTPMLPEILSNDLCSLRQAEERPVMAVRMACDSEGSVSGFTFGLGLIRSRARLTYEQTQHLFDDDACLGMDESVAAMLRLAAPLARRMIARRAKRGALDLDLPEAEFVMDPNGRVTDVRRRQRLFSHRLIEVFMIAANEAAARFLMAKGIPFPLRVHPAPDPDRLDTLYHLLRETALAGKVPDSPSPSALRLLLEDAKKTPQAQLVARLILRAMMQARYFPGPAEPADALHFGLASTAYCHFTSPIRRYADLLVHRAIKLALDVPASAAVPARQKLLAACEQCNARERAAQNAEREITRRLACLLLEEREGESFRGTVSGVTEFGFFVEPDKLPVDGMVRLESLSDDWYALDEARQCLTGARTGRRITLGQAVTVRLVSVNVGRLEIDFSLEGSSGKNSLKRRASTKPAGENHGRTPSRASGGRQTRRKTRRAQPQS